MWFQLKAYLNFLLHSSNQHGIHSPFVYQLVTKCFYDKKKKSSYQKIKNYRDTLFQEKKMIEVKNFETDAKVFSSEKRKVATITKTTEITWKQSKLLNRIIPYLKIENVVQLGTSVGLATTSMAAGNKVNIQTIEACSEIAQIALTCFKKHHLKNITLLQTTFKKAVHQLSFNKIDLAYINGNHKREATIEYFNQLLPYIHNDSVFIFKNIYYSPEMQEAWEELKKHPSVSISIDTFCWGFIFFRKEQHKEHFKIRL